MRAGDEERHGEREERAARAAALSKPMTRPPK
jgi:hypothetical protein